MFASKMFYRLGGKVSVTIWGIDLGSNRQPYKKNSRGVHVGLPTGR